MSDKLKIVYVGDKPFKKDTITSSRLLFKRGEEMAVDTAVARRLLEYPKVWVEADEAKAVMESAATADLKRIADAELSAVDDAKKQLAESFLTKGSEGEVVDLAKLTGPQLSTLVEAEELTVTVKANPVNLYRVAVRDAMRTLYGTPELTQE